MSTWSYEVPEELSDEQYARWQALLEQRTGICFLQHKSILQTGLNQRLKETGYSNYEHYFNWVSRVPDGLAEWTQLIDCISVNETSFFREPEAFGAVRNFLAEYLRQRPEQDTLNLWSLGCATGEEAYSLAMVASDVLGFLSRDGYFGVVGMDISRTALAIARKAEYAQRKLEMIPVAIRNKHFSTTDSGLFKINSELKKRVCFAPGNIIGLHKMPPMNMDVIFFQNVLIYFQRDRQEQVVNSLVKHLKPGGLLVLGPGEINAWQHPQMQRYSDERVTAYIKTPSQTDKV
jgi:chemotaxis protein methyltransferase CheR/type IV pilus assembly protein PilK